MWLYMKKDVPKIKIFWINGDGPYSRKHCKKMKNEDIQYVRIGLDFNV